MATVAELMVRIGAETTGLQRGLRQAETEVKGFKRIGEGMASTGATMSKFITLPILAAAAAATKFGIDFQTQMEMIHTQAGASQHEVDALSKSVLQLATTLPQSPEELAKGLYHIESVGIRGAHAMQVLHVAALGAATGNADLEDTVNALAGAWVTGIKGVGNMHRAMGILNATVGSGNMRMGDLAKSLSSGVLPAARTAGLGLQDVAAAMALLTDESVPPAVAATRLRMTFSLLAAPSKAAEKQLQSIGVTGTAMAQQMQGPQGLIGALSLLKSHLDGLSKVKQEQILSRAFGGGRSGGTIMSLVNNLDRLRMKYDQIGKTASHFNEDVARTQETDLYKLKAAWSSVQVALIEAGAVIAPVVVMIAQKVAALASAFTQLSPSAQHWIEVGMAVAAVIGPLIFTFGKLIVFMANVRAAWMALTGASMAARTSLVTTSAALADTEAAALSLNPVLLGLGVVAVGLGALFLSQGRDADALAASYDRAKAAIDGLKGAMGDAKQKAQDERAALHQVQGAALQVAQAHRDARKAVQQYGHHSLQARTALLGVKEAQDNLTNAQRAYRDEAHRAAAATQKWEHMLDTARGSVHDLTDAAHKNMGALDGVTNATRITAQNTRGLAAAHVQLTANAQNYITKAQALAASLDAQAKKFAASNPLIAKNFQQLSAVARAAAEVARRINAIPTEKQIHLQMFQDIITSHVTSSSGKPLTNPAGKRAGGGPVRAGEAYVVGEHRAELFVPDQNGRIEPRVSGGGVTVVVQSPVFLTGDRQAARQLARFLHPELARIKTVGR